VFELADTGELGGESAAELAVVVWLVPTDVAVV
jgi:hypothetical protein